ncbi:hypothetical protein SAMN02927924_03983 [Sphingobium faniae]|nr:hypothetical protein SAMN02927924_03983 [Sphingobium faniae]
MAAPFLFSFPELGKEIQISLGEDMLRQGYYIEEDGIEISAGNNIRGYKLSPGFYPQISEDRNNSYHSCQMTPTSSRAD